MRRRSFVSGLVSAGLLGAAGMALSAQSVVIDVRTPGEYTQGHVEGAINLPHDTIGAQIASAVPDRTTSIILYCRSGRRSALALESLKRLGYSNVENYGGLDEAKKRLGDRK